MLSNYDRLEYFFVAFTGALVYVDNDIVDYSVQSRVGYNVTCAQSKKLRAWICIILLHNY